MREDHIRRYARHILLPDFGGHGQTALLAATARVSLREVDLEAGLVCATYLAAGGAGAIELVGATAAQIAGIAAHGPDARVVAVEPPLPVDVEPAGAIALPPPPAWWPAADGDRAALACWRGALAAIRWMADRAPP